VSKEHGMRKDVVLALRGLGAVSVENGCGAGTPDINHTMGWIELKSLARVPPKGGPLRVPHFTPQQRAWLFKRDKMGGLAQVLLKVGKHDWMLLSATTAFQMLGRATYLELLAAADWASSDGLDGPGLEGAIRRSWERLCSSKT